MGGLVGSNGGLIVGTNGGAWTVSGGLSTVNHEFSITNTSGGALTDVGVTMPIPIATNTITGSHRLVLNEGVTSYDIQEDARASDNDSYVRMSRIAFVVPSMTAGETKTFTVTSEDGAPVTTNPITVANILATSLDVSVTGTIGGTAYSTTLKDALGASTSWDMDAETLHGNWAEGPILTEVICSGALLNTGSPHASKLRAWFHLKVWKANTGAYNSSTNPIVDWECDVIMENTYMSITDPFAVCYDLDITATDVDGTSLGSALSRSDFKHWYGCRYTAVKLRKDDITGEVFYRAHNWADLVASKVISNFDIDLTSAQSEVSSTTYLDNGAVPFTVTTDVGHESVRTVATSLNQTGGRVEIGYMHGNQLAGLRAGNQNGYRWVTEVGEVALWFPWQHRVDTTGKPVDIASYSSTVSTWPVLWSATFGQGGADVELPGSISGTDISFSNGTPSTITKSGGGLIAAGFKDDSVVDVSASGTQTNEGQYAVESVTDTVITLKSGVALTNESAGVNYTLNMDGHQWGTGQSAAHFPSITYAPYILTGDFKYIEAMHFNTQWLWGYENVADVSSGGTYWSGSSYTSGLMRLMCRAGCQERTIGWTNREMGRTALMTPDSIPDSLLPNTKTTLKNWIEDHWKYRKEDVVDDTSTTTDYQVGKTFVQGGYRFYESGGFNNKDYNSTTNSNPWQLSYINYSLLHNKIDLNIAGTYQTNNLDWMMSGLIGYMNQSWGRFQDAIPCQYRFNAYSPDARGGDANLNIFGKWSDAVKADMKSFDERMYRVDSGSTTLSATSGATVTVTSTDDIWVGDTSMYVGAYIREVSSGTGRARIVSVTNSKVCVVDTTYTDHEVDTAYNGAAFSSTTISAGNMRFPYTEPTTYGTKGEWDIATDEENTFDDYMQSVRSTVAMASEYGYSGADTAYTYYDGVISGNLTAGEGGWRYIVSPRV